MVYCNGVCCSTDQGPRQQGLGGAVGRSEKCFAAGGQEARDDVEDELEGQVWCAVHFISFLALCGPSKIEFGVFSMK